MHDRAIHTASFNQQLKVAKYFFVGLALQRQRFVIGDLEDEYGMASFTPRRVFSYSKRCKPLPKFPKRKFVLCHRRASISSKRHFF